MCINLFSIILLCSTAPIFITSGESLEHSYLSETHFPITRNNYVIISGCSGGGKSTLLAELKNRGFLIVLEPGRQIT